MKWSQPSQRLIIRRESVASRDIPCMPVTSNGTKQGSHAMLNNRQFPEDTRTEVDNTKCCKPKKKHTKQQARAVVSNNGYDMRMDTIQVHDTLA